MLKWPHYFAANIRRSRSTAMRAKHPMAARNRRCPHCGCVLIVVDGKCFGCGRKVRK